VMYEIDGGQRLDLQGPIRLPSRRGVGQVCDPPCIVGRSSTRLDRRTTGTTTTGPTVTPGPSPR
jgi:hypothetical protein